MILLYIAGHETTVNLIGNGTYALLRHRSQLERWRDDPALDANAVDELLRYDCPVQFSRRITTSELEVGDRTIERGVFVLTCLAAANRDPAKWGETAQELDVTRAGAAQHLAFGVGHPPLPGCGTRPAGGPSRGRHADPAVPRPGAGDRRPGLERPPRPPRPRPSPGHPGLTGDGGTGADGAE